MRRATLLGRLHDRTPRMTRTEGTTNSKGHKNTEVGQIKSEQVFNAGKSLNCNKCKDDEGLRNKNT